MTSFSGNSPLIADIMQWLLNLAMRLLARALQMPEPLVQSTGRYVVAQAQAVEDRFARSLCPIRLFRRLLALIAQGPLMPPGALRRSTRGSSRSGQRR
ncbi:hypothetical protein [Bradyrhizobium sp. STM 3562]|uniref:hypothetical protein n=1 Tax=Bradyrhizobium sp. STM 3562 TaxID=578924 RepID=UPI00388D5DB4